MHKTPIEPDIIAQKLQRLWKGTLFIGISGIYILIIALMFIYQGWRPGLLTVFFLGLSQFFRYIANDVDRIGWTIKTQKNGNQKITESTKAYQVQMLYILVILTKLQNIAIIYQVYFLAGTKWMISTFVGLSIVELLYMQIRSVNKKIEFEQASYGIKDRDLFFEGPELISKPPEKPTLTLEEKLAELKKMSEQGQISKKAYEETRDKYLIRKVMRKN
jgi:uncharacterized membrane protein